MAIPSLFWIELALGVVLLFLTAKAHGRQIRLERELEGYMEVGFMKENPPWVEALWKKDRRRFWMTYPPIAAALGGYTAAASLLGLPPQFGTDPFGLPALGAVLLAGLLWAPVAAFVANGLASASRLRDALNREGSEGQRRGGVRAERGEWLAAAIRGTYVYWTLVGTLIGLAIAIAVT